MDGWLPVGLSDLWVRLQRGLTLGSLHGHLVQLLLQKLVRLQPGGLLGVLSLQLCRALLRRRLQAVELLRQELQDTRSRAGSQTSLQMCCNGAFLSNDPASWCHL